MNQIDQKTTKFYEIYIQEMYYSQKHIGYKKRIISVTRRRATIHSSNTCSVLISISVLTSVISTPSTFSAACPTPYRENKKKIKKS